MSHIHSWRRFKGDTFICAGETCYFRLRLNFLHKKVAKCPSCGKTFLVDITRVKPEDGQIRCADCRNDAEYTEISLEEQREILTNLIKNEFEAAMELSVKQLAKKQEEIARKEKSLAESREKLAKRLEELRIRRERLEEEYRHKRESLKPKKPQSEETEIHSAMDQILKKIMEGSA